MNLLDVMVDIVTAYSRVSCRESTVTIGVTCDLILEVIQGPCVQNQVHFAIETELMECLNSLLRAERQSCQHDDEGVEMKAIVVKIFKALTECQKKPSLVFERLMSAVHADSLTRHLKVPPPPIPLEQIKDEIERAEAVARQMQLEDAPLSPLQVECIVLIQMLCDYNPNFAQELQLSKSVMQKLGSEVVSIEIVWNNEIERRFFPVPEVCKHLTSTTRKDLVDNVDRENIMQKQQDFMRRSRIITCELEHQDNLRRIGLSGVFSRTNQNRMTWISFFINCVINIISLQYLAIQTDEIELDAMNETVSYRYLDSKIQNDTADLVQTSLNWVQIFCASFTLVLYLFVRSPVVYMMSMREQTTSGATRTQSHQPSRLVALTAVFHPFKGLTPYYIYYLAMAVGGREYPIFNSILLFDILVKNSTARDVLLAVAKPIKALAATLALVVITMYCFSFLLFIQYRGDFIFHECDTLGACFLTTTSYGLRRGGGIGEYINEGPDEIGSPVSIEATNGRGRFWVDVTFFMLVNITLLNIIFGIIIDNFAELRDQKKMRATDTNDSCFVCGISRQRFEDSVHPLAFQQHIAHDHCMWNYVKFMVYVWHQDRDDDDGLEQYVRGQIEKGSTQWFPTGTCMVLKNMRDQQSDVSKQSALIEALQAQVATGMDKQSKEAALVQELVQSKMRALLDAQEAQGSKTDKQISALTELIDEGHVEIRQSSSSYV